MILIISRHRHYLKMTKNSEQTTEFKLGELFCGPGGIALGAKMASENMNPTDYRISHAWATDYDRDTCDTYRNNICPDSKNSVVHADIRKLNIERLEKIFGL